MATPKILIVDDDLNIQRILVFALKQEGYETVLASDGETGVQMALSEKPDLILMGAAMSRLDGYTATAQIRSNEQGTRVPIILVSEEASVQQRVRALRAGADDEIVKPFNRLELLARIKALLARNATDPVLAADVDAGGKIIAFYPAKGGVGTTTIAINTAIALARVLQKRVLVMDANLQFGDFRVFLDLGLDNASIVNAISEPDLDGDLLRTMVVHHETGVDVLLAPPNPAAGDIVVERAHAAPDSLTNLLKETRRAYDYTVIDMSKAIDDFNLQLFDEADLIFVVMTADLSCLKNVRLVLETLDSLGYQRNKVELVLNRANANTGINLANAEEALGRSVEFQILNDHRTAMGALNSGAPIMSGRPESPLGKSLSAFAREIEKETIAAAQRRKPRVVTRG
jgi:pilus assembly protein CpaE